MEDVRAQSLLLEKLLARLHPATRPHCMSARRDGDTLVVSADSAAWATRLRYEAARILGEMDARNLRVRVAPPPGEPPRAVATPPTLPESAAAALRETAKGVTDPDLAAALLRLAGHRADGAASRGGKD